MTEENLVANNSKETEDDVEGQNIQMTKTIDHALRFALLSKTPSPTPSQTQMFSKYCDKKQLPVSIIFSLSSFLKTMNKKEPLSASSPNPPPMFIHQLLEGATIAYVTPKPPPTDPVVSAKLAELRARKANLEYEQMVRNVTQTKKDRWEKDTRELNGYFSQLSIGLNIIVSMATTLTAGYWIGKMWVAPNKPIIGIAIGVVLMVVVLMAEVWLFIFRAERLNKQLARDKRERERASGILVTGLPPMEKRGRGEEPSPPAILSAEEKKNQ